MQDSAYTVHPGRTRLLHVNPEFIVPIPLHLLLGIGNKIILECLPKVLGEKAVVSSVLNIKTTLRDTVALRMCMD